MISEELSDNANASDVTPQEPASAHLAEHDLRPEHIVAISRLLMLMAHHDEVKRSLEEQINTILGIGYGANLKREHWEIDIDQGKIYRTA